MLFSLSPNEFSLLGTILGFILAQPLTINQQNSFGNFLELVGQVILTINAQAVTIQANNQPSTNDLIDQIERLKIEMEYLKRKINGL